MPSLRAQSAVMVLQRNAAGRIGEPEEHHGRRSDVPDSGRDDRSMRPASRFSRRSRAVRRSMRPCRPVSFITERMTGNIMGDFSSRGPYLTEPNWIKPDITAPGVRFWPGMTPEPNDGSFGELFQYLQGTSMSTPHVSGIAALLIERHSELDAGTDQVGADDDGQAEHRQGRRRRRAADPFDFGAGHMVPNRAIDPGLTYDAGLFDYLAATCGTVSPLVSDEDCAALESLPDSIGSCRSQPAIDRRQRAWSARRRSVAP